MEQKTALQEWSTLFESHFDAIYRYFARRVATPQIVSVLLRATFDQLYQEFRVGVQHASLLNAYRFAWRTLSSELNKAQPKKQTGRDDARLKAFVEKSLEAYPLQSSKKSSAASYDADQVYRLRFDPDAKVFYRPPQLDVLYDQLSPEEREVLFLTYFEQLSNYDRAYVLDFPEEKATQLFYEAQKKVKDFLQGMQLERAVPERFVQYFGNVGAFLERTRKEEEILLDLTQKQTLHAFYMNTFHTSPEPSEATSFPQEVDSPVQPIDGPVESLESPFAEGQFREEASAKPLSSQENGDFHVDWISSEDYWGVGPFLRRLQSVFATIFVVIIVAGLYVGFFGLDRRMKRFLADERVTVLEGVEEEELHAFVRDAVLYIARNREFASITIQRLAPYNDNGSLMALFFDYEDGVKEDFFLRPNGHKWEWQTREYHKLASLF